MPGNTTDGNGAQYKIYGTNQPYYGRVVQIGNKFFTTEGGVLEGNSKELIKSEPSIGNSGEDLVTLNTQNNTPTQTSIDDNPVISTFFAPSQPRYFRPNGTLVVVGAPLHQHQDGTIMTEHSMGPNDNSVVVTTTPPSPDQVIPPMLSTEPVGRNGNGRGGNGRGGNGGTGNIGGNGGGRTGGMGGY